MTRCRQPGRSDLFLVRLWSEETEEGAITWCGKVQPTTTGEARFFHGWPELVDLLLVMSSNNKHTAAGDHELEQKSTCNGGNQND